MLGLSWSTFRDRWQLFVGAVITVSLGVALFQSSLLSLLAAVGTDVPDAVSVTERRQADDAHAVSIVLLANMTGLSTFVAAFIVSSTFAFTVAQRRRDLAMLRLVGADRVQVRSLLVGEALFLGSLGALLGVPLGLVVNRVQLWMLTTLDLVPEDFTVPWRLWILPASVGVGVAVAVAGVLGASYRAGRIGPLEALRDTGTARRPMTLPRRWLGTLFAAGTLAELVMIPFAGIEGGQALSMNVSITLGLALTAFAPVLIPWVSRPLERFGRRGTLGQLATANLRVGVRRTASTAAPVMLLFAFVAGQGGAVSTFAAAGEEAVDRTVRADLVASSDVDIRTGIAAVDGVGGVSEEIPVGVEVDAADPDDEPSYVAREGLVVDPGDYARAHDVTLSKGDLGDLRDGTVLVPAGQGEVGDTVHLRIDGRSHELTVAGVLPRTFGTPVFLLARAELPVTRSAARTYLVALDEGADRQTVASELRAQGAADVATRDRWVAETGAAAQSGLNDITVALLALLTLYTVIAIVNAVVVATSDRREEFATARVSGLTRGQVVRMAVWESLTVSASGIVLGGLAAIATVLGVLVTVWSVLDVVVVSLLWLLLGALAAGVFVLVGLSTVVTTLAATRTTPVQLLARGE